ncbi:hypothetical protein ACFLZV_03455 [Candidatus Margulisiibacteriota bacterium]
MSKFLDKYNSQHKPSNQATSFVITNLMKKNQRNYYCLQVGAKGMKLGLMEARGKKILEFDFSTGEMFRNNEKMEQHFALVFKKKIDRIISDLKNKKARIYSGDL